MGEVKNGFPQLLKKMKNANLIGMFFLSMALAAGVTACKHRTPPVDIIPNSGGPSSGRSTSATPQNDLPGGGVVNQNPPPITQQNIPLDPGIYRTTIETGTPDREKFKEDTLYFDFDSSAIKPGQEAKLQKVADYFKANTTLEALVIEGNCDERGTEKYNLSLGERRALAAREYLANLGVKPERIKTVTYGASRPAEPGHNEEAWKKNRRDDFILMTPK